MGVNGNQGEHEEGEEIRGRTREGLPCANCVEGRNPTYINMARHLMTCRV